jgi:hypothetical protein
MLAYLAMMAPRLIELRRVLRNTGSILYQFGTLRDVPSFPR